MKRPVDPTQCPWGAPDYFGFLPVRYPIVDFTTDLIVLIPFTVAVISGIPAYGDRGRAGMVPRSCFVKTAWHCFDSMSAFPLLDETRLSKLSFDDGMMSTKSLPRFVMYDQNFFGSSFVVVNSV